MSSPIKGTMPGLVRDPLHSDLRAAGCRQPRQRNPGGAASIPNHHFEHERRPQADMSAEALILKHRHQFDGAVVAAAERRLTAYDVPIPHAGAPR